MDTFFMPKWVLLKNNIKVAESDSITDLIEIIDKDISSDEATYEIAEKDEE
jgi:hypothetical protein